MKSVLQDAAITSPVLFTMCVTVIKDDTNTNIYSHDFILYLFFDMIYDVRPIKPNDTSAPNNVINKKSVKYFPDPDGSAPSGLIILKEMLHLSQFLHCVLQKYSTYFCGNSPDYSQPIDFVALM